MDTKEIDALKSELANLKEENESLRKALAAAGVGKDVPLAIAPLVAEKMAAGLPRETAIAVAEAQMSYDQSEKKAKK